MSPFKRELLLLGLTWLFAVAGGLSVVAPAVMATAVTLNLRERRFRSALLVVLLSPFGLGFLFGVRSYWFGTGTSFFRSSQASAHQYGLDPMSRAPIHTGFGCFPSGNEWVVAWPSTVGLHLMAHLFGPMPGSYDGAFPEESDIQEVLSRAQPGVETGSGYMVVDGRRVPVDPELLLWADWCFDYRNLGQRSPFLGDDPRPELLRAGFFGDRVLVFGHGSSAAAVDLTNGKGFAYFGDFRSCFDTDPHHPPGWEPGALAPDPLM